MTKRAAGPAAIVPRTRGIYYVNGVWEVVDNLGRVVDVDPDCAGAQEWLDTLSPLGATEAQLRAIREREVGESYLDNWRAVLDEDYGAHVASLVVDGDLKAWAIDGILAQKDRELSAQGHGPVATAGVGA